MTSNPNNHFDIIILGTGIAGTMLGAILARHGVSVLLIDSGTHPRFAIGESIIPSTASKMRTIAHRYAVPEIAHLSNYQKVSKYIGASCGVKRNFGFVYHRAGKKLCPEESNQLCTIAPPAGPDSHLYRQDIDAYMVSVAVRYNATVRQSTKISDIDIQKDRVVLTTERGDTFKANYLVDASGYMSQVAKKFDLRETPCPFATHSRTLFTHMIDVLPWDNCGYTAKDHGLVSPLCQGTLHHIFDGGWLWVIPFNNHSNSTNPLCSVGLNLDQRQYPRGKKPPDQEFKEFLENYPSIAAQFQSAQPVRNWIATDRLQYSSRQIVGERFCLMPHAAGFIDPLYSGGLHLTVSCINLLANKLLKAVSENDYSTDRFRDVEVWTKRNLSHYDRVVSCSYTAFSNFNLWNAWFRVWSLGSFFETLSAIRAELKYYQTGDKSHLAAIEKPPYSGALGREVEQYMDLFNDAASMIDNVQANKAAPAEASDYIFSILERSKMIPPQFKLSSPKDRFVSPFTALPSLRMVLWGRSQAPDFMKQHFFDIKPSAYLGEIRDYIWSEFNRSIRNPFPVIRDILFSWNNDWKKNN